MLTSANHPGRAGRRAGLWLRKRRRQDWSCPLGAHSARGEKGIMVWRFLTSAAGYEFAGHGSRSRREPSWLGDTRRTPRPTGEIVLSAKLRAASPPQAPLRPACFKPLDSHIPIRARGQGRLSRRAFCALTPRSRRLGRPAGRPRPPSPRSRGEGWDEGPGHCSQPVAAPSLPSPRIGRRETPVFRRAFAGRGNTKPRAGSRIGGFGLGAGLSCAAGRRRRWPTQDEEVGVKYRS